MCEKEPSKGTKYVHQRKTKYFISKLFAPLLDSKSPLAHAWKKWQKMVKLIWGTERIPVYRLRAILKLLSLLDLILRLNMAGRSSFSCNLFHVSSVITFSSTKRTHVTSLSELWSNLRSIFSPTNENLR